MNYPKIEWDEFAISLLNLHDSANCSTAARETPGIYLKRGRNVQQTRVRPNDGGGFATVSPYAAHQLYGARRTTRRDHLQLQRHAERRGPRPH